VEELNGRLHNKLSEGRGIGLLIDTLFLWRDS